MTEGDRSGPIRASRVYDKHFAGKTLETLQARWKILLLVLREDNGCDPLVVHKGLKERFLIWTAGFPATTVHSGTSLITTARAPTTAPSPTVTPGPTNAPAATQARAPMVMGLGTSRKPGSA